MRCACIDVGSNTTRLLVADTGPAGIAPVTNERVFTLIGRSLAEGNTIPAAKLAETASVVAEQARRARELGAERVRAVATAAIRRAANATELVAAVEERAGLELEVLAGEHEARLAFRGAAYTLGGGPGTLAVIDVGGGSTEVAFGDAVGNIESALSLPVGSSLLADRYLKWDPPSVEDLESASAAVASAFDGFEPRAVERAVAVGGSASSLQRLAGDELGERELRDALHLLAAQPADELAQAYGLEPERVRLLPAGLLVLAELSARLGLPLRICKGGLREGVILEMIKDPANGQSA